MSPIDDTSDVCESAATLLPRSSHRLNVVLVEPEIALNTGSIGRTCVAAGAMLWLVRPLGFHIDDRHLRRAGLDYWEHLTWRVVDGLDDVVAEFGRDRLWSYSTKASRVYTDVSYRSGDALIFGPESRGLPRQWLADRPDQAVRIPMRPEARSLNLANAVAIAVFEAVRQLGGTDSGENGDWQSAAALPRALE
jgi:tRNA (cytidine/uridine-2'-O-)-methyltransferase